MKTFTKIFLFLTLIVTTSACSGQYSAPAADPCQENPCENGGKCKQDQKGKDGYTCTCGPGYSGDKCEKSPCDGVTCNNVGNCVTDTSVPSGAVCKCQDTFYGENCEKEAFQIKVHIDNKGDTFEIGTQNKLSYNYDVDCGNGEPIQKNLTTSTKCTYQDAGKDYIITITGDYPAPKFAQKELKEVVKWGSQEWESMKEAFYGCTELTSVGTTKPHLSKVTDMSRMFYGTTKFNSSLNDWDVSHVINMSAIFQKAESFNSDLSKWNIGNVINMNYMFYDAKAFDQNLKSWETEAVKVTKCDSFGSNTNWSAANRPSKLPNCSDPLGY